MRVGLVLRLRRDVQRFHRAVLGGRHLRVDDREAVVAHFRLHVRRKARRDEGAHQHHRGLALEQERLRAVEIVGQRVVDEVACVDQRFPRRVDLLHARVGVRHVAGHQLLVERVAVHAQVEIVEPAGEGPRVAAADRDRRDAGRLQLLARVEKLVPRLRLVGDADLAEQVLAIEQPPRVVDGRRRVLLAVVRRCVARRRIHRAPAVLRPVAAQVLEQPALRVVRHPFARVPVHDVRCDGREPGGELHLVRFLVDEGRLHVDVGMRLAERFERRLPDRALAGALERDVDRQRAGIGGRRHAERCQCDSGGRGEPGGGAKGAMGHTCLQFWVSLYVTGVSWRR